MKFLGGTTSLVSFLRAYKTSETRRFFPCEWFDHHHKMQNTEPPSNGAFITNKLRSCDPLEIEYMEYVNLLKSETSADRASVKIKLSKPPPIRREDYHFFPAIWEHEVEISFRAFLWWYNNRDVVPTLKAMQKMTAFYDNKTIEMLKLGCPLTNLANIYQHKCTDSNFYLFTEADNDLFEKI